MLKYILAFLCLVAVLFFLNSNQNNIKLKETSKEQKTNNINISLLLPLSTKDKESVQEVINGAKLAIKEIGTNVFNLTVLDSQSLEAYKKNSIIIGGLSSHETKKIIQKLDGQNLFLYLSDGEVFTCLNKGKKHKRIWGLGLSKAMYVEPLLLTLADKYKEPNLDYNIFLYTNFKENYSINYLSNIIESLDFKILETKYVDTRINDIHDIIREIFAYEVNLLIFDTHTKNTLNFYKTIDKLSIKSEMQVAASKIIKPSKVTNGIWTATSYSYQIKNRKNKAFKSLWEKHYPKSKPSPLAVKAYNAVHLIDIAAKESNSYEVNDIEESLSKSSFAAPQGDINFSNDNQLLIQPLHIGKIKNEEYQELKHIGVTANPKYLGCSLE